MKALTRTMMLALVCSALAFTTACKKKQQEVPDQPVTESAPAPQKKEVALYQYRFNPNTLTVPVGTTVVFKNKDPERHNVRIAALNIDQMIDAGQSWNYKFDTKGEFAVDNRLATNPMSMTIVVE
jgi:plastocyanin